jgi:glycosyltransferase involved in cell wall biosynthesis
MTPALIALPGGLALSGVALFTARLASHLAGTGRAVTLALHAPAHDQQPLPIDLHPAVRRLDLSHLPPIEHCRGHLGPYLPLYRDALGTSGPPTCFIAGQHGDIFGIAAALAREQADAIRIIGVAHSDNGYDLRLLSHYASVLARAVGVSSALQHDLQGAIPDRPGDVLHIPYGVPVPAHPPARPPLPGRPLRLLYAGRIEHRQKRILALPILAQLLRERGFDHTLTIVGAGPALDDLRRACAEEPSITLHPPADPQTLAQLLAAHDAFVLPSRFEGLSVAMLEAMAAGCVPVVTPSRSGTRDAVIQGVTGQIAAAAPDDDEPAAARALADALDALRRRDIAEMARQAHRHAQERFSLHAHGQAWDRAIDHAADAPARSWPADRPCAFGPAGSVPPDAAERMAARLARLDGQPVCLHGAGAHTLAVAHALAAANIVAVADDDRQRHGSTCLGLAVIAPEHAAAAGAAHVIISSHLHEHAIWQRRRVYEAQGLTVHRLYAPPESP